MRLATAGIFGAGGIAWSVIVPSYDAIPEADLARRVRACFEVGVGYGGRMVQVIQNRADIEGRLVAVKSDPARPDHKVLTIEVGTASPVEGYPNLFGKSLGKQLDVLLPANLARPLKIGTDVRCRIRRAGPAVVVGESCLPR